MKEKKLIDRSEERKEEKREELEDKKRLSAKGVVVGGALTTTGGALLAGNRFIKKKLKSGEPIWVGKIKPEKLAAKAGVVGGAKLAIGLPTLGISAYKHYKYKKEGKKNDSKA